jgi:2-oxo-hept-3-ene-1,7-dioate hydratase
LTTVLNRETIDQLAERLDEAERTKTLIRAFTRNYPDMTIDDAYGISVPGPG